MCHQYWPQGRGTTTDYGKYAVTFKDKKAFSGYVMRKFEIVEKQSRMSVTPTGTKFYFCHIGNCQPGAESADEHWKQTYCRIVQVSCTWCFYWRASVASETLTGVTQLKIGDVCLFII